MDLQELLTWLSSNGYSWLVDLLNIIFGLVIMIVQLKKFKFQKNQSKEDILKYRTANYRDKVHSPAQSFATEVDQFRLNKSTNELEKLPDKLDIQQLVQSAEAQALPNMLQHLEPELTEEDVVVDYHNDLLDNLDMMREADNYRLGLCEKYKLNPTLSLDKVIAYLNEQEAVQRGKIEALQKAKKGGIVDEKEEIPAAEPQK